MEDKDLMFAIFGVVEHVLKAELTNISKTLILNYYKSSEQPTHALAARESVFRYAQCRSLPKLEDIRKKGKTQLDKLEHLVLRMEYEAARLDGSWPPAAVAEAPPAAAPETSSFAETLPIPPGGKVQPVTPRSGAQTTRPKAKRKRAGAATAKPSGKAKPRRR